YRHFTTVGETVDLYHQWCLFICLRGRKAFNDLSGYTHIEHFPEFRYYDAETLVIEKLFKVAQCKRYAGEELRLAFKQSTEAISAQHLQQTDQNITIVLTAENVTV